MATRIREKAKVRKETADKRPRAKGSASRILKRTSHITVVVAPRKEA